MIGFWQIMRRRDKNSQNERQNRRLRSSLVLDLIALGFQFIKMVKVWNEKQNNNKLAFH